MSEVKFKLERVQGAPVADQEILRDMQIAAQLAGTEVLSQRLYSEFGQYDPTTASRRFGSWNKAVAAAGLQTANEINISDERLFENVILLWEHYGRQPRRAELASPRLGFLRALQATISFLDGRADPIRHICKCSRRATSQFCRSRERP